MAREPLKLSFKIDPVKTTKNGYSYDEVVSAAEKICLNRHCVKVAPGEYAGGGNDRDLASVGMSIRTLVEMDWFRACVKEMYFIGTRGTDDMIEHYKQKGFVFDA